MFMTLIYSYHTYSLKMCPIPSANVLIHTYSKITGIIFIITTKTTVIAIENVGRAGLQRT